MNKTVKIIVLMNNQILISEITEIGADIGQPDCKLINPFVIKEQNTLEPWLVSVSRQDTFMLSSDKILTIVEPMPTLLEKYEELLK